eukprot:PhF_6_TR44151/c0_g1_i4/m.67548
MFTIWLLLLTLMSTLHSPIKVVHSLHVATTLNASTITTRSTRIYPFRYVSLLNDMTTPIDSVNITLNSTTAISPRGGLRIDASNLNNTINYVFRNDSTTPLFFRYQLLVTTNGNNITAYNDILRQVYLERSGRANFVINYVYLPKMSFPVVYSSLTRHFYNMNSNSVLWTQGDQRCQSQVRIFNMTAYMATTTSIEENKLLSSVLKSGSGWLCAQNPTKQCGGTWQWFCGPETGEKLTFLPKIPPWNSGEPSCKDSQSRSEYLLERYNDGPWNDAGDSNKPPYCEY